MIRLSMKRVQRLLALQPLPTQIPSSMLQPSRSIPLPSFCPSLLLPHCSWFTRILLVSWDQPPAQTYWFICSHLQSSFYHVSWRDLWDENQEHFVKNFGIDWDYWEQIPEQHQLHYFHNPLNKLFWKIDYIWYRVINQIFKLASKIDGFIQFNWGSFFSSLLLFI